MSVMQAYNRADCIKSAWNITQILKRKQHNPAQLTGQRDELINRIVVLEGGTSNYSNVKAILDAQATIAGADAAIAAL